MAYAVNFVDGPLKGQCRVVEGRYFQCFEFQDIEFGSVSPDEPVMAHAKLYTYEVQGRYASLVKDA